MEKYARASGHPRLVELLSRHASEQKDKFTLSDDEDQARTAAHSNRQTGENKDHLGHTMTLSHVFRSSQVKHHATGSNQELLEETRLNDPIPQFNGGA